MSPGADSRASRSRPSPVLLLLGLLLLPAVVGRVIPAPGEGDGDLHCICVKTTSEVHAKHIMSLEVIRAGLHCPISQLIATLKNGRKICLDPQVATYKKIVRKLIESKLPAV